MHETTPSEEHDRRRFFGQAASVTMAGGLLAGYGMFANLAVRFLYPADPHQSIWQFVSTLEDLKLGDSLPFTLPSGSKVLVTRQTEGNSAECFIALSSICPHLGCAVHWEGAQNRFFCPCHNGAFDAQGAPIEGPPLAGKQFLTRFDLAVQDNLLMIRVPTDAVRVTQEGART